MSLIYDMHKTKFLENSIKIDRTTKWGNPYKVEKNISYSREISILKYSKYINNNQILLKDLHELYNKNFLCWCNTSKEWCHGEILQCLLRKYNFYKNLWSVERDIISTKAGIILNLIDKNFFMDSYTSLKIDDIFKIRENFENKYDMFQKGMCQIINISYTQEAPLFLANMYCMKDKKIEKKYLKECIHKVKKNNSKKLPFFLAVNTKTDTNFLSIFMEDLKDITICKYEEKERIRSLFELI